MEILELKTIKLLKLRIDRWIQKQIRCNQRGDK